MVKGAPAAPGPRSVLSEVFGKGKADFEPDLENDKEEPEEGAPVTVWGRLLGFAERLDDELFKSLQAMDSCTRTSAFCARRRDSWRTRQNNLSPTSREVEEVKKMPPDSGPPVGAEHPDALGHVHVRQLSAGG